MADDAPDQALPDAAEPEAAAATAQPPAPDPLAALQAERDDLRDRLARARADYDNLQKRHEREALLERERVRARVLEHFLQVYEYGRMAATEADKEPGPLAEGIKMVVREFDRLLEMEGVEPLGAVGEPFDGKLHEALGEEAVAGVAPGQVSRVLRTGYLLGERVLRYAQVMVAPRE